MRGILLCAGPSLARYQPQLADLIVAVNRAALTQPCSVWACGDWPLIQSIRQQVARFQNPLPKLFTAAGGHAELRDRFTEWGDPAGSDVIEMEALFDGHEHELRWTTFTATAALWFCFCRGVKKLDVYGADWSGLTYCDGTAISQNRQDDVQLWPLEISIWTHLVKVLAERGMLVERHT